jgi:hypothetical protein
LFGTIDVPKDSGILINENIIMSDEIIKFFKYSSYTIECEYYNTENKFSLIIFLKFADVKYGITKIEPSFDGAKKNVSQTKGIIYYFQQYPNNTNHIWQLLKNISK